MGQCDLPSISHLRQLQSLFLECCIFFRVSPAPKKTLWSKQGRSALPLNEHRVIREGIGLVSCVYVNGETGQFWIDVDSAGYQPS